MQYSVREFDLPENLEGISSETIREHLGLYSGYVKHVNLISEKINAFSNDLANNTYAINEMQRRLGFEFCGMRNHEYYFEQFVGGATTLPEGKLKTLLEKEWGTVEAWQERFVNLAMTRGVGWAMLYFDPKTDQLVHTWVDEQHLGQLVDLKVVLALDMWEHSYAMDYPPSRKREYIDAVFRNLNWEVVARRVE